MNRERLWLAVRFPTMPITSLATHSNDRAQAVVEKHRIFCANRAARAMGINPGLDNTTAQLLGDCELLPRDEPREVAAVRQLIDELYRFTPHIEHFSIPGQPQQGLLLEISTCLNLFGGSTSIVAGIEQTLTRFPHLFYLGLGHTSVAAWLLSDGQYTVSGLETRELFLERLRTLPVEALDSAEEASQLQKMGFASLGDIASQIERSGIGSLRKRLGHPFAEKLSEIFDSDGDLSQRSLFEKPVPTFKPREAFSESIQFDYPVCGIEQLKFPMEMLLQKLEDYLRGRQLESPAIEWRFCDIKRRSEAVTVRADQPQTGWQLFYDLTLIHFDHRELPFEVDSVGLSCKEEAPLSKRDQLLNFSSQRALPEREFERTAAKLKARVGEANVYKLSYCNEWTPEATQAKVALSEIPDQSLPPVHQAGLRPSWLFSMPEPVEIRGDRLYWKGYLELMAGPERICGSWWEATQARDYYMARRHDAVVVWIYRDLHERCWFVHGVFT